MMKTGQIKTVSKKGLTFDLQAIDEKFIDETSINHPYNKKGWKKLVWSNDHYKEFFKERLPESASLYVNQEGNLIAILGFKSWYCEEKNRLIRGHFCIEGQLPFIPTMETSRNWLSNGSCGTMYRIPQITEEDNKKLSLKYTWNGGSHYSFKWEEVPHEWIIGVLSTLDRLNP